MFGAGAGNIADMIARMKDVHKTKENIKKYRELGRSYKYHKILHKQNQITIEELNIIKAEMKQYRINQRNTFLFFLEFLSPSLFLLFGGYCIFSPAFSNFMPIF